jgi:DNA-binding NtrC family response regulator
MSRILSISYDEALLHTREMMLKREGFEVESALGFSAVVRACEQTVFDLVILGTPSRPRTKSGLSSNCGLFVPHPSWPCAGPMICP